MRAMYILEVKITLHVISVYCTISVLSVIDSYWSKNCVFITIIVIRIRFPIRLIENLSFTTVIEI